MFYHDRTIGNIAELFVLEFIKPSGLVGIVNPAPDPDDAPDEETRQLYLRDREAYDLDVGMLDGQDSFHHFEYWEIKTDWYGARSGNVCIELATLEHTRSDRLVYLLPKGSWIQLHTFTLQEAWNVYENYPKKLVGQYNLPAVCPSQEITKSIGIPLWQLTKQLTLQHA